MRIITNNSKTIVKNIGDFNLTATLDGGQAFRWNFHNDGWHGIVKGHLATIYRENSDLIIETCHPEDFKDIWYDYLGLDRDYSKIYEQFKKNIHLEDALFRTPGIRILNQPEFECLISFILSANNNIKRFRSIIERICINFGDKITDGQYSFPSAKVLSQVEPQVFKELGAGYRAPYIAETAKAIYEGFPLSDIKNMDVDTARDRLKELKGVGEKVANCVLLFSCKHRTAFPVDTWIKKAIIDIYPNCPTNSADIRHMVMDTFGEEAGLAQQYLFYNERIKNNKL